MMVDATPELGGSYTVNPVTGERKRVAWTRPADATAIPEAQPAADAEGQQAQPEPGSDGQSSDAGAPAPEAGNAPADDPVSETGEVKGAAPAAAPDAAPDQPPRRKRS